MKTQKETNPPTPFWQVLRKAQVCKMLAISTATLDRERAKGNFPAPIKLGEQAIGWTVASIQSWLESRPVAHHFVETL